MSMSVLSQRELPTDGAARGLLGLAERGILPDDLIRVGIRRMCARRLNAERQGGVGLQSERFRLLTAELQRSPIALHTTAANAQHYELPTEFFRLCLGRRLKYSSCYYPAGVDTLDAAEEAMLALYAERAELADGQDILELGCGWGSLSLWMAERFPGARITAVTNSASQAAHVQAQCQRRGLANVRVVAADINALALAAQDYDRVVSIEMFEHLRNYERVLQRLAVWLRPQGKLFVHIFAHRTLMYPFETEGEDNWLGRHFFTGGLMPSTDTLLCFQRHLQLEARWLVDGTHYERTANHWLANQDRNRAQVQSVLERVYGLELAPLWFQRWRMFWMSCAELFGYAGGQEWLVAHYRLVRPE